MTFPSGTGANTNLGTASGKVRIEYESVGSTKTVSEVTALHDAVAKAGVQMDQMAARTHAGTTELAKLHEASQKMHQSYTQAVTGMIAPQDLSGLVRTELDKVMNLYRQWTERMRRETRPQLFSLAGESVGVAGGTVDLARKTQTDLNQISNVIRQWKTQVGKELTFGGSALTLTPKFDINESRRAGTQMGVAAALAFQESFKPNLRGALGGAGGGERGGGHRAGGGLGSFESMGSMAAMRGIGGITASAGIAAVAVGALGYTLAKGFSRLENLDAAANKLHSLGHSTQEVQSIMDSALKAVDKTAFSLDQAANTAAQAVAAGIKPGQQLTDYLTNVADAAATAGVSMSDMGYTFNQVATQGKLTGDQLQTLQQEGIPVLQYLADQYGVTSQKAQEMVSNGQVSFARFEAAMHTHLHDAAANMGNSIRGSFDNLRTGVARLGAELLKPIFGKATGEASSFALAMQSVTRDIDKLTGFLKSHEKGMVDFWNIGGQVALTFASVVVNAVGATIDVIGGLIKGISWVPRAFAAVSDAMGFHGTAKDARDAADAISHAGDNTFHAGRNVFNFVETLQKGSDALQGWADRTKDSIGKTTDLGAAVGPTAQKMISLSDALDKLSIKQESATKGISGTIEDFHNLQAELSQAHAPTDIVDTVTRLYEQFNNGGRAARDFGLAIDKLGDSSSSADDKAKSLIESMRMLGGLPKQDELKNYNQVVSETTGYQSHLVDQIDAMGKSLTNMDGTINSSSKNGQTLVDTLEKYQQATFALAASGEATPEQAWGRTHDALTLVLRDFGIFGPEADKIINTYIKPQKDFTVLFKTRGEPEIQKELTQIVQQMNDAKAKGDNKIDFTVAVAPQSAKQLQETLESLGAKVREYDPKTGTMNITVPPDSQLAKQKDEIQATLNKDPTKLDSVLKVTSTQHDILQQVLGNEQVLHIPTVLDIQNLPGTPATTPNAPGTLGAVGTPGPNVPQPSGGPKADLGQVTGQGWKNVAAQGQPPLLVPDNAPALGPNNAAPPGWYWESNDPNAPAGSTVLTPVSAQTGPPGGAPPAPGAPPAATQGPQPVPNVPGQPPNLPASAQPPPNALQPTDLSGLLGDPNAQYSPVGPRPTSRPGTPGAGSFYDLITDQTKLQTMLAQHPDIAAVLQPKINEAQAQGKSFTQAFAEGINSNDQAVKDAITKLAQLAADGIGSSPAKYGPLSGDGWTYFRGATFTQAWAEGIASQTSAAKAAVTGTAQAAVVPLDDQITQFVKDMSELSSFGQHLQGLASQVADIGFGFANIFNTLSHGRLSPKNYVPDVSIDTRRSRLGPWSPSAVNPQTGQPVPGGAPGPLGAAPGKQDIANYIIQSAMSHGYSREEANAFVTQATGESGLTPTSYGANTGDATGGASGIFQFTPGTWQGYGQGGNVLDPQANIDAYFRLAAARDPRSGDIRSRIGTISGGGPATNSQWGQALTSSAPYIAGFTPPPATSGNAGLSNPLPGTGPNAGMPGAGTNYNPDWMIQHGFAPLFTKSGADATQAEIPQWMHDIANRFGLPISSHADRTLHGGMRGPGNTLNPSGSWAVDIGGPGSDPAKMEQLAQFLEQNYQGDIAQLIHRSPTTDYGIAGGQNVGGPRGQGTYYTTGEGYSVHPDHVHVAFALPLTSLLPQGGPGAPPPAPAAPPTPTAPPATPPKPPDDTQPGWKPADGGWKYSIFQGKSFWLQPGQAETGFSTNGFPLAPAGGWMFDTKSNVLFKPRQDVVGGDKTPPPTPPQMPGVAPPSGAPAPPPLPGQPAPDQQPGQPPSPWNQPVSPVAGSGVLATLMQNDPQLAAAVAASQGGAGGDWQSAVPLLQHIDSLIADQNATLDANQGNQKLGIPPTDAQRQQGLVAKDTADALGGIKSGLQSQYGLKEAPSGLEQAQALAQGASGVASDIFQTFDAGLKAIEATQHIADTLVRGIHNTQDIENIVTDVQKYITLAQKIFQTAGDITSMAGSFTGGADFGGVSAAGGMLSLIGQALGAVNTAIDLGKEAYHITTKYVGRFLTSWLGFPGAQDMKFLLDTKTGQLQAYTSANPDQKTTFNTAGRQVNPGGYTDARSNPTNNFNIYQGPGQDPRDTMNDAMFAVRASGVGAFGYAN